LAGHGTLRDAAFATLASGAEFPKKAVFPETMGYMSGMTVVIDKLRHPEKAHRPETPLLRKPDWIRVKAPVSR
jgi:hypothetical protein